MPEKTMTRPNMGELEQLAERILVGLAAAGDAGGDNATPDSLAATAFLDALAFLRVRALVRGCGYEDWEEMLYRFRNDALLHTA
jgi:hypothetical protein